MSIYVTQRYVCDSCGAERAILQEVMPDDRVSACPPVGWRLVQGRLQCPACKPRKMPRTWPDPQ